MIKKISYLTVVFAMLAFRLSAQTEFTFDVVSHDFGVVEEGDEASYSFKFTNTGKDTIKLKAEDVRPGCGCTSKDYTKTPIAPGTKGEIIASYGTMGRVGTFNKVISVFSSGQLVKTLYIRGIVIKKDTAVTYTEKELKSSAKITLDKTAINFGKVEKSQKVIGTVVIKNAGKDTLKITSVQAACSCVNYKLLKDKSTETVDYILPGKSAVLELTYMPSGEGKVTDIATIYTNDKAAKRVAFTLDALIVESLQDNKSIITEPGSTVTPFGK